MPQPVITDTHHSYVEGRTSEEGCKMRLPPSAIVLRPRQNA